jgi:hypothetical protein
MYDCWQRSVLSTEVRWREFFRGFAASNGLKAPQQVLKAWDRIAVYFHDALQLWKKTKCDPVEAIAFLRVTEEFWFDDTVELGREDKIPELLDTKDGVLLFYPRMIDGQDHSRGHMERAKKISQTCKRSRAVSVGIRQFHDSGLPQRTSTGDSLC